MIGSQDQRRELILRLQFRRVFRLRIWLGFHIMRLASWVMGSTIEAADV